MKYNVQYEGLGKNIEFYSARSLEKMASISMENSVELEWLFSGYFSKNILECRLYGVLSIRMSSTC